MAESAPTQPDTSTEQVVSFGEASGRIKADYSLNDKVGTEVLIKSYSTEERNYKGKPTHIAYITIQDGKVAYTWSETVVNQLALLDETLATGKIIRAKVTSHKSGTGTYISLE